MEIMVARYAGFCFGVERAIDIVKDAAKEYCDGIQQACERFEDAILAPSIAVGCVMRTNVEESFKNILSDAEYAMLENKFTMKNAPGYKERLEKGLKKA